MNNKERKVRQSKALQKERKRNEKKERAAMSSNEQQ